MCGGEPAGRPFEHARVVLDPVAEPELPHHLHVVLGPLANPVRLEQLALGLELLDLGLELAPQAAHRGLDRRLRRHVLRGGKDREIVELRVDLAGEGVEMRDLLDLVAEERDPIRGLRRRGLHLDHITLDPEATPSEQRVVADVLRVDQLAEELVAVVLLPHRQVDEPLLVLLGRAEAVDARDRGDDHRVAARQERRGGGVPETVDVVVAGRVLLDVEIGLRNVRLRLVVVVVGDEVLDGVRREELAELVAQLRRERLVVRDHEGRSLQLLDQPRHRRRLPRARRAEERLEPVACFERGGQLGDRVWLIAGGRVVGGDAELGHPASLAKSGEHLFASGPVPLPLRVGRYPAGSLASRALARSTSSSVPPQIVHR